MALRAVEHIFSGETAPLFISNGTVSVSGTAVTGTDSFFTADVVGMKIGFGSTTLTNITTWYTISAYNSYISLTLSSSAGTIAAGTVYVITGYDSTKTNLGTLMIQKTGVNPEDNFIGPFPVAIARPAEESTPLAMLYPHVIPISSTIDWVFLIQNAVTASKSIFLYEYNKVTSIYNWKGFITVTTPYATSSPRGFRAFRYLHTTGTVGVAAPALYSATSDDGTVSAVVATGIVTGVGTAFELAHVGMMIGFGSTNPALINCWYPIKTFTNSTSITIYGLSSAIAASTAYVIATCTVTGNLTKFVEEGIAAGTGSAAVAGGLGPCIGFGSKDPTQITQWYNIGRITDDEHINLVNSPGVIVAGTDYVIEELRFIMVLYQTGTGFVATNSGLYLLKGAGYGDFMVAGNIFPMIASNVDNERGVYWLKDMAVVTNTTPCGCAIQPEVNKGLHYAYVLDGFASLYVRVLRYNLRATGTVTAGVMTLSVAYTTAGTVTIAANGTDVTGDGTAFTIAMIGMKIGFGSTSPALITTWYTIASWDSATVITLTASAGAMSAGTAYIIDSADVISTGSQLVTGTMAGVNNGRIGTLHHGPGADEESLYFVTITRIYRAALSKIFSGNLGWISDNRPEIPPGSAQTFALSSLLAVAEIADTIDRLIVMTVGTAGVKQYVTRYPMVAGDQFDRVFGLDDKQQDQSAADPNIPIHFNSASQATSVWSQGGIAHILKHGTSAALCQLYALPLGAHWTYAPTTNQRIISPSISTPDCISYTRVMTSVVDHLGSEEFRLPTASILIYYRTNGISDNTGGWTLVAEDGNLSGLSPAASIQFMFEFVTISLLCIPGRLMSVAVLYEDYSTDSHFQPSVGKADLSNKRFAWRFSTAFNTTVPALRIRLFDAVTGGLLVDDNSSSPVGTWEKSTNGGTSWVAYGTLADKGSSETTYIRYTPATLPQNIKIRSLLTLN